jgi:hypothetical protein
VANEERKYEEMASEAKQTGNYFFNSHILATTVFGAKILDELLSATKMSEERDYFALLVKIFDDEYVNSEENKHLHLFYLIIPALTTSYVDGILHAKNTITKKSYTNTYMTVQLFSFSNLRMMDLLLELHICSEY